MNQRKKLTVKIPPSHFKDFDGRFDEEDKPDVIRETANRVEISAEPTSALRNLYDDAVYYSDSNGMVSRSWERSAKATVKALLPVIPTHWIRKPIQWTSSITS